MKDELKNVITGINKVYYIVDLRCARITAQLHNALEAGPYKLCRNIQEANLFSLNILRQNAAEFKYKTGKLPETQNREFLGNLEMIETVRIIPTMKWLQKTFPEKFI